MKQLAIASLSFCIIAAAGTAASGYQRHKRLKEPKLPGIIHSGPCKPLAPGVYDCGDHKNRHKKQDKRSGRWRIVVRPTDDVTITAQSKAEREARRSN